MARKKIKKICEECGKAFVGKYEKQRLCCVNCRINNHRVDKEKICEFCGKVFFYKRNTQKFCCVECAQNAMVIIREKVCEECGKVFFHKRKRVRFCCFACAQSYNGRKQRGKKCPEETKEKIRVSTKKRFEDKKNHPWYDKEFTEDHKRKLSERKKILFSNKEAHPMWRGGISYEPYGLEFNKELKMEIRERDNFTCQECGEKGLDTHHIDYNKKNNDKNNLIILCRSCHAKTNFNRKRWTKYFENLNKGETLE